MAQPLIIIGAGGHGRETAFAHQLANPPASFLGFLDDRGAGRDDGRFLLVDLAGHVLRLVGVVRPLHVDIRPDELDRIDGGGVRVDGGVVSDKGMRLDRGTYVVQVGKRKFKRLSLV